MRFLHKIIVWLLPLMFVAQDNWAAETAIAEKHNLLLLPAGKAAAERLQTPTNLACSNTTLRSVLSRYGREYQFAYWIDRRVDADTPVELSVTSTLENCLNGMAALTNAEVGLVENVVVIAPRGKLAALQAAAVRLHDQLSRSEGANRPAKLQPLEWPMLTTPNEFAGIVAKTWQLKLPHAMPHDLMDEGRLPPCTFSTQLTLLYGGFDEAVIADETGKLTTKPLDNTNAACWWRAVYSLGNADPGALAALNSKVSPVSVTDRSVEASGDTAFHLRLLAVRDGESTRSRPGGRRPEGSSKAPRNGVTGGTKSSGSGATAALEKQRFTFELKDQTAEAALAYLSQNLKFELKWSSELTAAEKAKRVTLKVEQAPIDELLTKIGNSAGLSIRRTGTLVEVSRK